MELEKKVSRILMTTDTIGGVWTYSIELINQLEKLNIEVILVTMGPKPNRFQYSQVGSLSNVYFFESTYKLEWMDNPWLDIQKSSDWLLSIENSTNPDIIHLNGFCHGSVHWNAPVVVVGHSCICSWFDHVKNSNIPEYLDTYKKQVMKGLHYADCVVAPSKFMLLDLFKHYGNITHATVIYNGLSITPDTGIEKEPLIFSAGRLWDEAKNVKALLDISASIQWPIFVAGENHQNTPDSSNVNFLGLLNPEEILRWMEKSSIYCLPAKYEPFGFTPLEAAINGCALVLGDIGSLREIWVDAAIYVQPDDYFALQKVLNHLIQTPAVRVDYSNRAINRARQFSAEKTAIRYVNIYNCLLNKQTIKSFPQYCY